MPFSRFTLPPQANYTAQERARAGVVYAKWRQLEPRCDIGPDEVLRLRTEGPMHRWDGSRADSGKWVQVSFLDKPDGSARLVAAAWDVHNESDATTLIVRSIKDVLDGGATEVYFYLTAGDAQAAPDWGAALAAVFNNLDVIFPGVFLATKTVTGIETVWRVKLQ